MKKTFYIILPLMLLMVSCSGSRKGAQPSNRYQRAPITEVTSAQLATEALVIDATTQQMIGNPEKALKLYRQSLKGDSTNAVAWYQMGKIMMSQGRLDSALVYAQKARKLDSKNVWYPLLIARIYEIRHDGKNLVSTWESIVKEHPDVVDYYYNLSNAHLLDNDVAGAIKVLNRVESRYGVNESVSLQKQRLWMALGKADKARAELEKLAASIPNDTRYNAILAEGSMKEKDYKKALQYYNQILANDPDNEDIHISLAQCHLLMGNLPQAYRHLRKGLMNPTVECKTRIMYAGELLRDEKFFKSYSHPVFLLIDTLMADCPPSAGHAYGYGILLASQKRYAEAAVQLRNHLTVDSSSYDTWESLLFCLQTLPDHDDEMLDLARRAARLFPMHVQPYYIQGRILLFQEQPAKALPLLERAERLASGNSDMMAEICYMLADCHKSLSDTARAITYYSKVLRLWPDNPYALNSYAWTLAEQRRDLDKAADMAQHALKGMPDNPNIIDTYAWILHLQGRCAEAKKQIQKAVNLLKEPNETIQSHHTEILQQCP